LENIMTETDPGAEQRAHICDPKAAIRARAATARNRSAWAAFFASNPDDNALCSDVKPMHAAKLGRLLEKAGAL
jgi:hypothetical protein